MQHRITRTDHIGASAFFVYKLCLAVLLSVLGATAHAATGSSESTNNGEPIYYDMTPSFTVNVYGNDSVRFMQISINIMTEDKSVIEAIEKHPAPIRHELVMLLSSQQFDDVWQPSQREMLRKKALERINIALKTYANISPEKSFKDSSGKKHPSGVSELYFTNFVIQ